MTDWGINPTDCPRVFIDQPAFLFHQIIKLLVPMNGMVPQVLDMSLEWNVSSSAAVFVMVDFDGAID